MPKLDINKARQAGYSDEQIKQYAQTKGVQLYDSGQTLKAGAPPVTREESNSILDWLPVAGAVAGSFIPGLGTIVGGAAGAGVGALAKNLLDKKEGVDAGEVVKETALGGVGGVAGKVIGRIGSKLLPKITTGPAERLMGGVFKESIKSTKAGIAGGKSLASEALERGMKGNTEGIYATAVSKIDEAENALQSLLMGSSKKVDVSKIEKTVAPMVKEFMQSGNTTAAKAITDRIAAIKLANGGSIPAAAANQIKRSLYDEASRAYGTEASAGMEGIKAIARGLKEGLDDIPGVKQINKDLSFFGRTRDSMLDKMTRSQRNNMFGIGDTIIGAGGLAGGMGAPAAATIGIKHALGSTTAKTSVAQVLKKVGQVATLPAMETTGKAVAQSAGQGAVRLPQISTGEQSSDTYDDNNNYNPEHTLPPIPQPIEESQAPSYITGYSPEQLVQGVIAAQKAGNDVAAKKLATWYEIETEHQKSLQTAPKKKTEGQVAREEMAFLVDDAIQQFQANDIKTGPIAAPVEEFKSIFNAGDQPTVDFNKTLASITAAIAKARAGTSFTPNEQKLLNKYAPKVGDSKQQILSKLALLKKLAIQNQAQSQGVEMVPEATLPAIQ